MVKCHLGSIAVLMGYCRSTASIMDRPDGIQANSIRPPAVHLPLGAIELDHRPTADCNDRRSCAATPYYLLGVGLPDDCCSSLANTKTFTIFLQFPDPHFSRARVARLSHVDPVKSLYRQSAEMSSAAGRPKRPGPRSKARACLRYL